MYLIYLENGGWPNDPVWVANAGYALRNGNVCTCRQKKNAKRFARLAQAYRWLDAAGFGKYGRGAPGDFTPFPSDRFPKPYTGWNIVRSKWA